MKAGARWSGDYYVTPLKLAEEWIYGKTSSKRFRYWRVDKFVVKKKDDQFIFPFRNAADKRLECAQFEYGDDYKPTGEFTVDLVADEPDSHNLTEDALKSKSQQLAAAIAGG